MKEHWWSLTLSWPDEAQRMFSTAHKLLNVNLIPQTIFMSFYEIEMIYIYLMMYYLLYEIFNAKLLVFSVMNDLLLNFHSLFV